MKSIPDVVAIGVAASLYATTATAQATFRTGQDDDIRFRWAVPETSASSGSGDVFFQLDAPDTYSWVGLGIGSGMRGAEIFLMYQDGDGNVTLSTREGEGHRMPTFSESSGVELIEGSGVRGSRMVANVRCSDCGSLDLEGENSWIAAWKSGDPLDSTDVREPISYHDGVNVFSVDFAQAGISSSADPFPDTGSDDGGNEDDDSGGAVTQSGGDGDNWDTIIMAHGIIMSIVFLVLYPVGSMLMPLLGKWLVHASFQAIAFLLMWAGFACGYVYANHGGNVFAHTHTRMGVSVVSLLGVQPFLGYFHHRHFLKHGRRGVISHIHIWYGRVLMALGIVTGGLGLALAGETFDGAFAIAYTVVAAVLGVAYIAAAVCGIVKRRRSGTSSSKGSPRVKA